MADRDGSSFCVVFGGSRRSEPWWACSTRRAPEKKHATCSCSKAQEGTRPRAPASAPRARTGHPTGWIAAATSLSQQKEQLPRRPTRRAVRPIRRRPPAGSEPPKICEHLESSAASARSAHGRQSPAESLPRLTVATSFAVVIQGWDSRRSLSRRTQERRSRWRALATELNHQGACPPWRRRTACWSNSVRRSRLMATNASRVHRRRARPDSTRMDGTLRPTSSTAPACRSSAPTNSLNRTMDRVEETTRSRPQDRSHLPCRQVSNGSHQLRFSTGVEVFFGQKRRQPRNGMGVPPTRCLSEIVWRGRPRPRMLPAPNSIGTSPA